MKRNKKKEVVSKSAGSEDFTASHNAIGRSNDMEMFFKPGMVRVIHGSYDDLWAIAGMTVAAFRSSLLSAFNTPPEMIAHVNGSPVGADHRLLENDVLEFRLPHSSSVLIPNKMDVRCPSRISETSVAIPRNSLRTGNDSAM